MKQSTAPDFTAHQRADRPTAPPQKEQEALRHEEARLRHALDAARVMVWQWDFTTESLVHSDNAAALLGLVPETTIASPEAWFALVHAEDLPRYRAAIDTAVAQSSGYTCPFRLGGLRDGMTIWLEDRGGVTRNSAGTIIGVGGVIIDVTEREKAQERSRFVIETSRILGSAVSVKEIAAQLARKIVEGGLATVCLVDLVDAADEQVLCASAHSDLDKEMLIRESRRLYRYPPGHPQSQAIATGRPILVPQVDEAVIQRMSWEGGHRETVRAFQVQSLMSIPLIARGRVIGALGIGSSRRPHFDHDDVSWATDLATRAAVAIDNAKLAQEREERVAAAEASEQAYRFLADSIPQFVWTTTPDGSINYVNQNYADYVGLSREDALLASWCDYIHPDDADTVAQRWRHSLRTGASLQSEQRLRDKDGTYCWFLLSVHAMRDPQGTVIRWVGASTNINELKRAQAEMDALLEAAPIGIALFDTKLRCMKLNRALAQQNGLSVERHLGQQLQEILPFQAALVEPVFNKVLETGEPVLNQEVTGRATHRPELVIHSLVNYYPVRVEEQVIGLATIFVDITERKKSELRAYLRAKVGASLADLRDPATVIELFPSLLVPELSDWCSLYLLGDNGDVELVALSHVDLARAARLRELYAQRHTEPETEFLPAATIRTSKSTLLTTVTPEALAQKVRSPLEIELAKAAQPSSWMMVPLISYGRTFGALGLGVTSAPRNYDESDLHLAEELGRRLAVALDNARLFDLAQRERRRAEEAGRAKDEFLAIVSHELRTPLNAMLGWTRMLSSGVIAPERQGKVLETIERNCKAQAQLIEDLLDTSRIITGKLRLTMGPVDLCQVVASAVETIRPTAEARGVRIEQLQGPAACTLSGDSERLLQIVWNLLSNAVKFTPRDGRVRVSVLEDETHLELRVEDTGQGIPASFLPHVFERFQQAEAGTTRRHGGLGLGLAIVQHLVELHGGTVSVHSEGEGKGTTFITRIPGLPVRPVPAPVSFDPASLSGHEAFVFRPDLEGLRVVVVDDELDALNLLQTILELSNVEVHTASTVDEALKLVREVLPDVLLSDVGMPHEDGYVLLEKVRRLPDDKGGKVPAVALTAYARMEDRTKALLAGYNVHVAKPIDPAALLSVLAAASGRKPR